MTIPQDTPVSSLVRQSAYMPQLDGLRALAVSAVAIHYFTDDGWGLER